MASKKLTSPISCHTPLTGFHLYVVQDARLTGLLTPDGRLVLGPGFEHDGASGPAINSAQNRKAAPLHDALYLLMEQGLIPNTPTNKLKADYVLAREMWPGWPTGALDVVLWGPRCIRSVYYFLGVVCFGRLFMDAPR